MFNLIFFLLKTLPTKSKPNQWQGIKGCVSALTLDPFRKAKEKQSSRNWETQQEVGKTLFISLPPPTAAAEEATAEEAAAEEAAVEEAAATSAAAPSV